MSEGVKQKGGRGPGPSRAARQLLRVMMQTARQLLIWVMCMALVYTLVAYFNWRWPRTVVLVFTAFGILILVLPMAIETIQRKLQ